MKIIVQVEFDFKNKDSIELFLSALNKAKDMKIAVSGEINNGGGYYTLVKSEKIKIIQP